MRLSVYLLCHDVIVSAASGAQAPACHADSKRDKSAMSLFSGTWRLVYSSAFASGSLGGFRPGPQAALVPVTIGQVRHARCALACDHAVE